MKLLLKLLAALVLLVVLLVAGIAFFLDPLARSAVEKGVTQATGSETTLESANIGILDGLVSFDSLAIANPPGFQDRPLLSIGKFQADWDFASLFSDEVVVHLLELDGFDLQLELNGTESNIGPLIDRLRELSEGSGGGEGGDEPSEPSEEPSGEGGPDILIERVRIAGVRTGLTITGVPGIAGTYSAEVPEITIEDLGTAGEKSGSVAEWSARIVEVVLAAAQNAGEGTFPAEFQALLAGDLDSLKAGLQKELEEKAKDLLDEQLEGLDPKDQEDLDKLEKKVKGLDSLLGG